MEHHGDNRADDAGHDGDRFVHYCAPPVLEDDFDCEEDEESDELSEALVTTRTSSSDVAA